MTFDGAPSFVKIIQEGNHYNIEINRNTITQANERIYVIKVTLTDGVSTLSGRVDQNIEIIYLKTNKTEEAKVDKTVASGEVI